MKLVISPARGEEWLTALRAAAPTVQLVEVGEADVPTAIRDADAFYGAIRPEWLAAASRLRCT